ncbi:MAG: histidine kinase [Dehalococcoidia bacterium]|nr:MAG: histidine kinase [Dehalococcoidia bacterium]
MNDSADVLPPLDLPEQPDVQELLASVIANITRLAGSEAGLVSIWDPGRARLRATSSYGLDPPEAEQIERALDAALPALIKEEADVSALGGVLPPAAGSRVLALPLRSHGRLVGLLCLFHPADRPPLPDDSGVVDVLSEHVDVILRNARLIQGIIEEKRWLEAIIKSTGEGLLILDAEGRIVGANPAFYRLTGLAPEQIHGRTLAELFLMPNVPPEEPLVEVRLRPAGRRVFEANRAIIYDDQGEPIGGVVSLRDITARREAEELQSTFFSVISHELKTPIAVIRGYAELIAESANGDPELRRQVQVIQEESQRLSRMVENLLEATRIQSGALDLNPEPIALGRLVRQVIRRMRRVAGRRRFVFHEPPNLPPVLADWQRIEQVVMNLIDNAIKYSPKKGTITISIAALPSEVVVRVSDEGEGVPEAERERIFERFSRLDSRMVRQAKGAGLGLFICKAIIEAHGGRIWVEEASGGGATFAFSLPREWPASLPPSVGFAGLLARPEEHHA